MVQPFFSRLSVRLLALGLVLVFLPAVGFLYLNVYERQLLETQERAMVQQGRVLAAAISGPQGIDPAAAERLLRQLGGRTEARLRIYGRDGALLADSSALGPRRTGLEPSLSYPVSRTTRESVLYRGGATLYRFYRRVSDAGGARMPVRQSPASAPSSAALPEVRAALAGRYGAGTRPTPGDQRSLTLYSAIPVRGGPGGAETVGAVLVSQSTFRILGSLVEVRVDIFKVFLLSMAAAIVLSLFVSATIARPLRRLREEANTLIDRRGRLRGSFRGSSRQDEIGHLTRALEQLTRSLEDHLRFIESFAADVSHEFKNPLATIRTATEMLAEVDEPEDRRRFLVIAQREVARMERLLSSVREITEIDARLDEEPTTPVELGGLLRQVAESVRLRSGQNVGVATPAEPIEVSVSPERLTQVFENLLDNAASFSPPGGIVEVSLARESAESVITVEDAGPGIPVAHLERVFDRFFRYRPGEPQGRDGHTGLGLAIVKAIVEGYGGKIVAGNRPEGGARFEIRLPVP